MVTTGTHSTTSVLCSNSIKTLVRQKPNLTVLTHQYRKKTINMFRSRSDKHLRQTLYLLNFLLIFETEKQHGNACSLSPTRCTVTYSNSNLVDRFHTIPLYDKISMFFPLLRETRCSFLVFFYVSMYIYCVEDELGEDVSYPVESCLNTLG